MPQILTSFLSLIKFAKNYPPRKVSWLNRVSDIVLFEISKKHYPMLQKLVQNNRKKDGMEPILFLEVNLTLLLNLKKM